MKKTLVIIVAVLWLGSSFLVWTHTDEVYSYEERRKLKEKPSLTVTSFLKGEFQEDFEPYAQDQFPARFKMREAKALFRYYGLQIFENNKYYIENDKIVKIEYPLKEQEIEKAAHLFNEISERYVKDNDVYYSIIFDKSFYTRDQNMLKIDYVALESRFIEVMNQGEYIDIKDQITLDDFYNTDIHWKQESLKDTAMTLLKAMNQTPTVDYIVNESEKDFVGGYAGHSALLTKKDTLNYISSEGIRQASVDLLDRSNLEVYDMEAFDHPDSYDFYLYGPQAIVEISNDHIQDGKELVIFRDSFASSITPYFIDSYSKITLIDLRYISPKILDNYLEFHDQDILFLFSTSVLNSSSTLKGF